MQDADEILFNLMEMSNKIKLLDSVKDSKYITNYMNKVNICNLCGKSFLENQNKGLICNNCKNNNNIAYFGLKYMEENTKDQLNIITEKYNEKMDICRKCTNTKDAHCNNFLCYRYATRKTLNRKLNESNQKLNDIEDLINNLSLSNILDKRKNQTPINKKRTRKRIKFVNE
jgi:hypothetical protein